MPVLCSQGGAVRTFVPRLTAVKGRTAEMNSYKYSRRRSQLNLGAVAQRRLITVLLLLLSAAVVVLSLLFFKADAYRNTAKAQYSRRLHSALVDAIEQANRLSGGVRSSSASRLALVRQNIHAMKLLNEISLSLEGERGRLVPEEALTALFDDLQTFETLIQTATLSTLEIRTTLLTHLAALENLLRTDSPD